VGVPTGDNEISGSRAQNARKRDYKRNRGDHEGKPSSKWGKRRLKESAKKNYLSKRKRKKKRALEEQGRKINSGRSTESTKIKRQGGGKNFPQATEHKKGPSDRRSVAKIEASKKKNPGQGEGEE